MTPLQRVRAVLDRQPTDRPPIDIWLTPEVLTALREHTGITDELALYQQLGVDKIVWIFPGYRQEKFDPNDSEGMDPWGVPTFKVQSGAAEYQEYGEGPLAEMEDPDELDAYPLWPVVDDFNVAAAKELAQRAREFQFATIGPWVSLFEIYCHMRGMENALMDVVAEPEFLSAALDKIEAVQTELLDRFLTELGDLIDLVFISDDMGTQESQLISVSAFEEHLKPRLTRWCELIHRHGKKVLFHTDGAARAFIPHLIEAGVDVLNPVQHICPGMNCASLQAEYGDRILFHGGIENQQVLPYGTPEDVREEVRHCLETLGTGGGYLPCSCHNIQAGTPVENMLAMIEGVQNYKRPVRS